MPFLIRLIIKSPASLSISNNSRISQDDIRRSKLLFCSILDCDRECADGDNDGRDATCVSSHRGCLFFSREKQKKSEQLFLLFASRETTNGDYKY